MKFKTKIYKLIKNKSYLKKAYLFYVVAVNNKFWNLNKNLIKKEKLKYYSINKFITIKNLANSLYINAKPLIVKNLGFLKIKKITHLKTFHSAFKLIGLKINKNFYNLTQIYKLKQFNYKQNINILIKFIKTIIKIPIKLI